MVPVLLLAFLGMMALLAIMLPEAVASDPGTAAVGTIFGGPFSGPLTFQETNLAFLNITEEVELADVIASLATGAAPAQQHALKFAVDSVQNVVGIQFSTQALPTVPQRVHPPLVFHKGQVLFLVGVQLSGAIEAIQWTILWKRPKGLGNVTPT